MSTVKEFGKSCGVSMRHWMGIVVEFVEGFREGAGDLRVFDARLQKAMTDDPDTPEEPTH